MSQLAALFAEAPAAGWLTLACLLLAAEAATGRGRLTWPGTAALAAALLAAPRAPGGLITQTTAFLGLSAVGVVLQARRGRAARPKPAPTHGLPTPTRAARPLQRQARFKRERPSWSGRERPSAAGAKRTRTTAGKAHRAPAVVGARGRALGAFCNGVGRVWIDRAEWAAELISGEALAPDHDVEVVGVSGGVRLRVRAVA